MSQSHLHQDEHTFDYCDLISVQTTTTTNKQKQNNNINIIINNNNNNKSPDVERLRLTPSLPQPVQFTG